METNIYKQRLEEEKARLETELKSFAIISSNNPDNWEAVAGESGMADTRDDVAERFEEMNERKAMEVALEGQLSKVKDALERIETGKFGICSICNKEIESDRLDAIPSANTCKEHKEEE